MTLVDLQKAFDTLLHIIIPENMTCLGFKTSVIEWFESYLSNRKFFVCECFFWDHSCDDLPLNRYLKQNVHQS